MKTGTERQVVEAAKQNKQKNKENIGGQFDYNRAHILED